MKPQAPKIILAVCSLGLLLLTASAAWYWWLNHQQSQAQRQQFLLHAFADDLDSLWSSAQALALAQRNYLLRDRPEALETFDRARQALESRVQALANPGPAGKPEDNKKLAGLLNAESSSLQSAVDLKHDKDLSPYRLALRLENSQQRLQAIHELMNKLQGALAGQSAALQQQIQLAQKHTRLAQGLLLGLLPLLALASGLGFWLQRQEQVRLKGVEEAARKTLAKVVEFQRQLLSADLDPQASLELALRQALALVKADGLALCLLEGDELACHLGIGLMQDQHGTRQKASTSLAFPCLQNAQPLDVPDVERDARVDRELCQLLGFRGMLIQPLQWLGQPPFGALELYFRRPGTLSPREKQMIQLMATFLSAVLMRGREDESEQELLRSRKQALQALDEAEERLQAFLSLSSEAFLLHDGQSVLEASPRCAELFGCAPSLFVGSKLEHWALPPDRAAWLMGLDEEKETPTYLHAVTKEGASLSLEAWVTALTLGRKPLKMALLRERSPRNQEAQGEWEKRVLQALLERSEEAVILADASGQWLLWNAKAQKIFGLASHEKPSWADWDGLLSDPNNRALNAGQSPFQKLLRAGRLEAMALKLEGKDLVFNGKLMWDSSGASQVLLFVKPGRPAPLAPLPEPANLLAAQAFQQKLASALENTRRYGMPISYGLALVEAENARHAEEEFLKKLALYEKEGIFAMRSGEGLFSLAFPEFHAQDAAAYAEKIRLELASIAITTSFGFSACELEDPAEPAQESLQQKAAQALEEAKSLGRNCTVVSS